jgi:hypothetical protein
LSTYCLQGARQLQPNNINHEMLLMGTTVLRQSATCGKACSGRAQTLDDRRPESGGMTSTQILAVMPPTVDPTGRLVFIVNTASGSTVPEDQRAAIEAALAETGR